MNYSPLEELCGILENEVRKINGQLSSGSTIDGADADLIKDIVMTIYYIKKSMRVPYENEMRGYPQMGANYPMWEPSYGRMSTGNFQGDWDSYGARARDSKGRYMDSEMTNAIRDIMNRTTDERAREDLRRALERV
jgi:hypothetical protein